MIDTRIKVQKTKRGYAPHKVITHMFDDALQLEKEAQELQKEIEDAEGVNDRSIIRKQKAWKVKKRNLDRRKVDVLNKHIFPSMANLTVSLEAMSESGFIEHMFREDLKSLFLSKSKTNKDRYKASRSIFHRFTEASCRLTIPSPAGGGYVLFDESRLILCDIMQKSIYNTILEVGERGRGPFEFDDPNSLMKTLGADIVRARAWTDMFASRARKQLDFDEDRRPALF